MRQTQPTDAAVTTTSGQNGKIGEDIMKAEFEVAGQKVELDTSEMESRINSNVKTMMEAYKADLVSWEKNQKKERGGKGVIETFSPDAKKAVVEEFQKGERCNPQVIKEQWTIAVPFYAQNELAGHLRDYVFVTDVVKGKPGETVNIPYIKDVLFEHVTTKTGTFAGHTGLVNVQTTTLHESGAYYDAYYGDIEKIDSNMLDELNRVFAHAAIRAEDRDIVDLLSVSTTADYSSPGATTRIFGGEDSTTGAILGDTLSSFKAGWIADGLAKLMQRGKEVRPGECILVIGAQNYGALLKELTASTPAAYTRGDIIQRGMVEDYLGVKIVPVGHAPFEGSSAPIAGGVTPTTVGCVYLMRPKRAIALAPKRDILIETDKLIHLRQLRIAASHTYGVLALDESEIVRFRTKFGDMQPVTHA